LLLVDHGDYYLFEVVIFAKDAILEQVSKDD